MIIIIAIAQLRAGRPDAGPDQTAFIIIIIIIAIIIVIIIRDVQTYPKRFLPELNKTQ